MITCGTNTNGIIYVAAGGNLTLGNSSTPLSITGASAPAIVVAMGTPGGTATIYANITGGSSTNAYGLSNAGTCTIYGNVTGGMMTGAVRCLLQQRNHDDLRQRHGEQQCALRCTAWAAT